MLDINELVFLDNPYQSNRKRVLCVCSAGLLRSQTMAWRLSQAPYNYNTRSCGVAEYALIPVTAKLVVWADLIVCAEQYHCDMIEYIIENNTIPPRSIKVLGIPDHYHAFSSELVDEIEKNFGPISNAVPDVQERMVNGIQSI